jgi:hypothetical protein
MQRAQRREARTDGSKVGEGLSMEMPFMLERTW